MTSAPESFAVPSPDQCWVGDWARPEPKDEMWALAAVGRTVHVLPALHPWRLGDSKGSGRVLLWVGRDLGSEGIAVLTRMGVDPDLQTGYDSNPYQFDAWSMLDAAHQVAPSGEQPCWLGGLAKIDGAWLPGARSAAARHSRSRRPWHLVVDRVRRLRQCIHRAGDRHPVCRRRPSAARHGTDLGSRSEDSSGHDGR